ncbi:MAG: type II toxin-antitoxin system prevent-host-death family antitoxin [Terracidiphilus sp.]|jgi:predicted nucleic acid-binding protein
MTSDIPKTKFSRLIERVENGEEVVITRSGRPVARFEPTPVSPRTFLDTNILLYGDDLAYPAKQQRALDLILEHRTQRTGVVSLQVIQEYFVNATRKLGLDPGFARQKVESYCRFAVVEPVATDILAAIDIHRLHRISYWDALVLHCARKAGCRVVLSEDMQHGQVIDGVRIVNPFL